MSRQLREHIRKQLKTILESKYGYYKDKDGRVQKGDLASAWKERMKSAIEDTDDQDDLSLKNVLKNLKDGSKSKEFKKVIQKKQKEIKEDEITEDDVTKAKKGALEAKIVADALDKEAKEKEDKLREGEAEDKIADDLEKKAAQKDIEAGDLETQALKARQKAIDKNKIEKKAEIGNVKESKKKLEEYIKEMIPSLLEADEEEGQEDDAFVPNHYKPEFIPREAEQTLERLGLTPIDRYVDFVNFMDSTPKSLKVVLTNGNSFLLYFDETGLLLTIGANEIDLSDDRNLPEAQDMINDLLMGPVDAPGEEGEEDMGAEEEVPAEEEPAAEEEPVEEPEAEA